ncbi:MAG: ribonuclease P protein component [Ruminococcus sp.]|nr:ribonuclease P protein component [Ruminococcus sp.]
MLFTTVIKDDKLFRRCFRKGRYTVSDILCVYYYPNGCAYNRLGITVTKKLGNAVMRNRIKRIIRAAYRLSEKDIPIGYDLVFVGRNDVGEKKSGDIESFIKNRLINDINYAANNGKFSKKKKKTAP